MRLTELAPAQLPAMAALIQSLDLGAGPDVGSLRHRTFGDPTCPPDLLLLAQLGGQIVGFCFACLREGRGIVKLFGVSEAHRRRGIGTALFDEIEARLRAREVDEVAVEGVGPNYFFPGVELVHTEAVSFLLRREYATDRVARVDLEVDLGHTDLDTAGAEARLAAEGIVLRRVLPEEIGAAAEFAHTHFSAAWKQEVADAARFKPLPLFIALCDERIIGFAAYDVTGTARFGPMGTHPEYRRRGIGGALLKMCLWSIRDRGATVAEISWTGPIGFYARSVGARIYRVYWQFRKSLAEPIASADTQR